MSLFFISSILLVLSILMVIGGSFGLIRATDKLEDVYSAMHVPFWTTVTGLSLFVISTSILIVLILM